MNWTTTAKKSHDNHARSLSDLTRRTTTFVSVITDNIVAQQRTEDEITFAVRDETSTGCTLVAMKKGLNVQVHCKAQFVMEKATLLMDTDANIENILFDFDTDDAVDIAIEGAANFLGAALATVTN